MILYQRQLQSASAHIANAIEGHRNAIEMMYSRICGVFVATTYQYALGYSTICCVICFRHFDLIVRTKE